MIKHNRGLLVFGLGLMLSSVLALPSVSLAQIGEWVEKTEMPTARYGMGAAAVDGNIYVIGGWDTRVFLKTVEMYDPIRDTWEPKADTISQGKFGVGVSAVNGKIYVIGGWNGPGSSFSNSIEEYDPIADMWTEKASMPTRRNWVTTAVVDGTIYAIGGFAGGVRTSIVEAYDPVADQWARKAGLPISAFCSAVAVEGKIYVMGCGTFGGASDTVSDVYEYDPITDTWTKKADMLTARYGLSAAVVDGEIYAIGGASRRTPFTKVSSVDIYDPQTDTWESGVDLPDTRSHPTCAVVEGKIYVIGGADAWPNRGGPPDSVVSKVEVFDTGTFEIPNPWDVNRDNTVNIFDLVAVASQFGQQGEKLEGDVNFDGIVNVFDLVLVGSHFGEDIVPAAPSLVVVRPNGDESPNYPRIHRALAELEGLVNPPRGAEIAIEFLRAWLASASPVVTETQLLPNFPNPFNPETWMPYQLREAAHIAIHIYDAHGRLVRTLDLGQRAAGFHISRNRAAYWDGRNTAGEPVASGPYFYQLDAGDFSATRQMLILK